MLLAVSSLKVEILTKLRSFLIYIIEYLVNPGGHLSLHINIYEQSVD